MRAHRPDIRLRMVLAIFAGLLLMTNAWAAAQESVLHSFRPSPARRHTFATVDGSNPAYANLARDAAGNLYGTTANGGLFSYGTVFKLIHTSQGWIEGMLYSFSQNSGFSPYGGVTLDAAGNVYGTTKFGGDFNAGVVFELVLNPNGSWTYKVLHSFTAADGYGPYASMIFDSAGNLYGTTLAGGAYGLGTVFELTPNPDGSWTEQVLHSFGNGTDGVEPAAPVVLDAAGNLYGTTEYGGEHQCGAAGCGIVFKLSPAVGGGWTEQVLHNFANDGVDGYQPFAGAVIFDSQGNLYGTTSVGGAHLCHSGSVGCGTVYELTPTVGGGWNEQVLYSFNNNGDGYFPAGSLLFDAAGNLYGTTYSGGTQNDGTVFKLTPTGGGWTEQLLHQFGGAGDGINPGAGLITDGAGNLYGTTLQGGAHQGGTAYEITP